MPLYPEQRVARDHDRIGALALHHHERCFDLFRAARLDREELDADAARRVTEVLQHRRLGRAARIGQERDARDLGQARPQQFERLGAHVEVAVGQTGQVAARVRQARDETAAHRIAGGRKDDRDRRGRALRRADGRRRARDDDVDLEPDQLRGEFGQALVLTVGSAGRRARPSPTAARQQTLARRAARRPARRSGGVSSSDCPGPCALRRPTTARPARTATAATT
jgi:hypothetical protein